MLSFRRHLDRRDDRSPNREIYYKLGAPPLSCQHARTILPNGHILLFDNGPHRLDQTFPFSRVLGHSGDNPSEVRSGSCVTSVV